MKEHLPNVLAFAVETEGSVLGGGAPGKHKVEGIGGSFIPPNFDPSVCDEVIKVMDEDAFDMVKELAAREGVLSGSSGGAGCIRRRAGGAAAGEGQAGRHDDSGFSRTLFVEKDFRRWNIRCPRTSRPALPRAPFT